VGITGAFPAHESTFFFALRMVGVATVSMLVVIADIELDVKISYS
jgi:hypothetical protein